MTTPQGPGDSFVQTSIDPRPPRPPLNRRKRMALISLAVAALLVIAGAAELLRPAPGDVTVALKPTATSGFGFTLLPTYTPAPLPTDTPAPPATPLPYPAPGWRVGGPANATTLAFAPSAGQIAYACGPTSPGTTSDQISASSDGGLSWTTLATSLTPQGPTCAISVDPTDPHDVALLTLPCGGDGQVCGVTPPWSLYRSRDGGVTWTMLALPPQPANVATGFDGQVAWVGSTLVAASFVAGQTGTHALASSVAGGAFQWIDNETHFATQAIEQLFSSGATIIAVLNPSQCGPQATCALDISRDGGATWTNSTPSYQQNAITIIAATVNGSALYGYYLPTTTAVVNASPLMPVISTDLGATWKPLPPAPTALSIWSMAAVPDGTVFMSGPYNDAGSTRPALFALKPGATAWTLVAANDAGVNFAAAQSDANGHVTRLWGNRGANDRTGALLSGLEYLPSGGY